MFNTKLIGALFIFIKYLNYVLKRYTTGNIRDDFQINDVMTPDDDTTRRPPFLFQTTNKKYKHNKKILTTSFFKRKENKKILSKFSFHYTYKFYRYAHCLTRERERTFELAWWVLFFTAGCISRYTIRTVLAPRAGGGNGLEARKA